MFLSFITGGAPPVGRFQETRPNSIKTRLYARALKGKRAHGSRPDKRGKNVTIVGAIALRGIIGTMSFKGGNVNGFDLGIQTWNDSKVYRFGATWFVYAE